jgi:hypothetical protein
VVTVIMHVRCVIVCCQVSGSQVPTRCGYFTPQTLRRLFEEAGLQVVEMIEAQYVATPQALKDMGLRGVLPFMIGSYPEGSSRLLRVWVVCRSNLKAAQHGCRWDRGCKFGEDFDVVWMQLDL